MITENDLRKICSSLEVLSKGKEVYRHNKVRNLNVVQEGGTYIIKGYVEGSRGALYYNNIEVDDTGHIYCECDCPAYHTFQGACKHNVGALYKFVEGMQAGTLHVHDMDEMYGKHMLDFYEQEVIKTIEASKKEHIKVEPKLYEVYEGSYALGLSIGESRLYVVKDIVELVKNILEENQMSYGKNLMFVHHIEAFEESAQPLIQFVIDQVVARQSVVGSIVGSSRYSAGDKKTLPLSPKAFDELFTMLEGLDIAYQKEEESGRVGFIAQNPPLRFRMTKKNKQFIMRIQGHPYQLIDYPLQQYVWMDQTIYKCEKTFSKKIFPILKFMEEIYPPQLKFDENGWQRFVLTILPKIKKVVEVKIETGLLKEYAPPELTIRLFLDRDESNRIVGHVEFDYEGYKFNPYEQAATTKVNIARDVEKEHTFNHVLEQYPFKSQKGKLHLDEESQMYEFITEGIAKLLELSEVHVTDRLKQMKLVRAPIGSVGLKVQSNLLQVSFEDINMSPQEIESILMAYREKSKYYRLTDGTFVDLQEQGINEFVAIVDGLNLSAEDIVNGKVEVPKYRALYLDQILRESEAITIQRDKYFKQIIRDVRNVEDTDFEVPESLKGILRGYQKVGYRWLKTMISYGFGGILADDMGLGKTLQVIGVFLSEKEKGNPLSLVVAPTSLVLNWEKEIEKFAPSIRTLAMTGDGIARKEKLEQVKDYDVIITSYDVLKRDIEYYEKMHFRFCIADEAHYVKNSNTQNAKALKRIKSDVCFALTGTPIENALAELWSIFDFIMPGYLFTYHHFKGKFETPILRVQDHHAMHALQKMIAPFVLRRLKKDVLKELPQKTETIILNAMGTEQETLYKANLALVQQELRKELSINGVGRSHIKILAMLTRLRQLCCHPSLYIEDYTGGSSKLNQCMELIREGIEGGHKILLFSQFTSMLDIIANELAHEQMRYYMLTGSTKAERRLEMVDNFNEDDVPVFLVSLKAGGTGLNLTGADIVIHYDPWWNVSSENQATDRAYRMGQKKNVQVFKLITENSIEEKIKALQDRKVGLADNVLQTGQSFINKMTEDEVKSLFVLE